MSEYVAANCRALAPAVIRLIPTNIPEAEQTLREFDIAKSMWGLTCPPPDLKDGPGE
jgi:hypothetical protein